MTLLDPPAIPADDRALLLGDGLFETIRIYGGHPFRLDSHLDRLRDGADRIAIRVPGDLATRVRDAARGWGRRDGALRITLTRGSGPGLTLPEATAPRLLVWVRPLAAAGVRASPGHHAVVRGRLDERSLVSGMKTTNYLERIQALRLARLAGADEALLRNSSGLLVEGSASNLLAVAGGTLIAPGSESGAIAGITREVLLEEAVRAGLSVEERGLAEEELSAVSELLLASSIRELVPVVGVEDRVVGSGAPGRWFLELSERFRARVEAEVRGRGPSPPPAAF